MVDIHSHVLPGVDDGARTWDIAVQMLKAAAQDGIRHVVATPHSNSQFRYDRKAHTKRLQELKRQTDVSIELSLGCDFHFSFENIQAALADPTQFSIGDTPYLLVEFSDFSVPATTIATLQRLLERGIVPVITHPERNNLLARNLEMVRGMVQLGCLVQITGNSLTGFWGESVQQTCFTMIGKGLVSAVATDAHDLRHRPPVLSEAREVIRKRYGQEVAEALCSRIPAAIVGGESVSGLLTAR